LRYRRRTISSATSISCGSMITTQRSTTRMKPVRWIFFRFLVFLPSLLSGMVLLESGCAETLSAVEDNSTFLFYLENDTFAGMDKHYTNAVKLSWISKDLKAYNQNSTLPEWARWLAETTPGVRGEGFLHNFAFSLGQNIYTPRDLSVEALIEDDRPYAGWTYFAAALHSKNFNLLNTLEASIGILGPSSLAEQSQKLFHKWLDDEEPKGWENQLEDELGLMVTWQRFWRILRSSFGSRFGCEIIPHAGISLGNVLTYANMGGEARIGYNLPVDFGSSLIRPGDGTSPPVGMRDPRISPKSHFGLTLFMGVDGRAIARNSFLDGNTWRDSHSVDKKNFVADISFGMSVVYRTVKVTYTHVYRTEEFIGQDDGQVFGSLMVAVTF